MENFIFVKEVVIHMQIYWINGKLKALPFQR